MKTCEPTMETYEVNDDMQQLEYNIDHLKVKTKLTFVIVKLHVFL